MSPYISSVILENASDFQALMGQKIIVTGGGGSLGVALSIALQQEGIECVVTDKEELDVLNKENVNRVLAEQNWDLVVHLAADKHAPQGEADPETTFLINSQGTTNIINSVNARNSNAKIKTRVVVASTCKACDPETVYGASKLIAERISLRGGHSVARFYNVVETSGNVFTIWEKIPNSSPIPVTPCHRFFLSINSAVSLLIRTMVVSREIPGRYTINPGEPFYIPDLAKLIFPEREQIMIAPRRGDRLKEPLKSASEHLEILTKDGNFWRIHSAHD
jgi:FlaA1/EpsC-like NDP-sugar epimerase